MSDRIAVMHAGRVEQLGTPEELYEHPTTRFVADFIGTTNLLSGAVESADAVGAVVRLDGGDACRIGAGGLEVGGTVELSVRPESILLKPTNGAAHAGSQPIRGVVEQVAYLGGNVQYQVRTSGGLAITALVPKTGERLPVGSDVDVDWPPAEALVLAGRPTGEEETTS
jgi:spermidine/putrescine transport system ATP-binding protein